MLDNNEVSEYFKTLQNSICKSLEFVDGKSKFLEDQWQRAEGGGGITRIIQDGNVIEKGGVLFSAVYGEIPEFLKHENQSQKNSSTKEATTFYATGVSIVIHPNSPMVPIIHMNVRYFSMDNGVCWFGGGIDLTPHYVVEEDAIYFHKQLKKVCDAHAPHYYSEYKKWADDYFFIKHRNETRGIGGIFFDRLSSVENYTIEQRFDFVKEVGESFAPIYTYFMNKNATIPFNEEHKNWQLLRRGRYVEFNLVYDRGTKFGLETNGRTESILMSLPKLASWEYNFEPAKDSAEAATMALLRKGIEWAK